MADHIEPLPSGDDSPWAHDVPIPPPPFFPASWSTGVASSAEPNSHDDPSWHRQNGSVGPNVTPIASSVGRSGPVSDHAAGDPIVDGALSADSSSAVPLTNRKRSVLVAGVIAVVAVAAVGTQVIGGGGESSRDAATDDTTVESSVEPADTEPVPATTRAPRRTTTTVATLPEPVPQWVTAPIELSPRLSAMTVPTELVALDQFGTLYSISIPTGVVRSIDTDSVTSNSGLVLGQESIVIISYDGGATRLAKVGQPLSEIDVPDGIGQVLPVPNADEFVVVPNQTTNTRPTPLNLAADGTLTPVAEGPLTEADVWAVQFLPTGEPVVADTGGLYVFDASGAASRVSTGDLTAVGSNHYVVRECDDARSCGYVRIEAATGERSAVEVGPTSSFQGYVQLASMSPDGSAMASVVYGDNGPIRRIVDLSTGAAFETEPLVGNFGYNSPERIWASDSSGVFVIDDGQIVLLDRTTGESIPIAPNADLTDFVAVAARPLAEAVAP